MGGWGVRELGNLPLERLNTRLTVAQRGCDPNLTKGQWEHTCVHKRKLPNILQMQGQVNFHAEKKDLKPVRLAGLSWYTLV